MNSLKGYFFSSETKKSKKSKNPKKARDPEKINEKDASASVKDVSDRGSRTTSMLQLPEGDLWNNPILHAELRADVMLNWLYQQAVERQYMTGMIPGEGVVIKKSRDDYAACPPDLAYMPYSLYDMCRLLNVRCAMTVNTRVINVIMAARRPGSNYIPVSKNLRLQVLPSMRDLPQCQKHHFAAFIEDCQWLVVWDDEPQRVLKRAENLESQLMQVIWGNEEEDDDADEKDELIYDLEASAEEPRRLKVTSAVLSAMTLTLCITAVGTGLRWLALEVATDASYIRLAIAAVIPIQMWVALFFFQTIVGNLAEIFGPVSCIHENSVYYSGKAPAVKLSRENGPLPHVTVQMPVYKEGLVGVIKPTVRSIKACISTYEMQGGTANIFINDDGMNLIDPEQAQARREFYEENNIGWVARPKHNPKPEEGEQPFLRRGKFKKASNMNFAMATSNRIEDKLAMIVRSADWTSADERAAYEQCLQEVVAESFDGTMAEGNIRIGDYILIVDSDTRVPEDCLLDAVTEMDQSPECAIMQYTSGVMRVSDSFFEGGVTWFTNLIYSAISFAVAGGDAPPFVGHNAVLRWSAIQDAASYHDEDGYEKFWSESHVSEDFDMSLRMQCAGYVNRFASYTGDGFKEGVSLTVYDELARWEKYAYGCNELIFHPFLKWPTRGPFTPLFRKFIGSNIHMAKKLTIMAYIGTYYAIGAAWALTVLNYFLTGWFFGLYDKYYLDSFAIFISIVVVFTAFGNVALAILRYRLSEKSLFVALWENLKWFPMFSIFLGGLSLHVSQAIVSHFLGVDMQWGATSKEVEDVSFIEEIPRIVRRFKGTFAFCFLGVGLIVAGMYGFPDQWKITYFASIFPLANIVACHFLLPVVLNPALMMFSW